MTKTVKFEKIVGGGKALGYVEGKPWFAAGPLPGETARVEVIKDKPRFVEAAVEEISEPAPQRTGEAEMHYLSCSPWQNVDYDYQLQLKQAILKDAFGRPELSVPVLGMVGAPHQLGYRNKLEFSVKPAGAKLQLAFHARGSYEDLLEVAEGCVLGSDAMNLAARSLVRQAHTLKLGGYIETLTVRQSLSTGQVLGHIALHQVPKRDFSDLVTKELAGVVVSRLRGRSTHERLWDSGMTELSETVGGVTLTYPYDGFFQTNVVMFEPILAEILAQVRVGESLMDLYGGVGTIGLAAASHCDEVIGVELNPSSVAAADANALSAGIKNYRSIGVAAAALDPKLLDGVGTVVVDPPRAGLEPGLVRALLAAAPARIIYLSCNPVTQARDAALLSAGYSTTGVTGYDMYPGTLHLESLMVFERL